MEAHEFLQMCEKAYGKRYEVNIVVHAISRFLKIVPSNLLDKYFDAVLAAHPVNWGLPDLAALRKVWDEKCQAWLEVKAENEWRKLLGKSPIPSTMIVDPVTFYIVSGYGTWEKFCDARDGQYRELEHSKFVKQYVSLSKGGEVSVVPRILAGHIQSEYGDNAVGIETQIIGDQGRGEALLQGQGMAELPAQVNLAIENMKFKE